MGQTVCILGINKMFTSSLLVAALILLNAACFSATSENTTVNVTEARARLDQGSIALSGNFLKFLISSKPDENCVASATSLLIPLAQLALYATGLVLEQLLKLLRLKSKQEIKAVFPGLTAEFNNQTQVEFEVATKYYANVNYPLSQNFKRDSLQYFQAEGENVDFSKAVAAAALINKWVSDRTRGKIPDLVTSEMFSADTRLCLVNAIYFMGNWVKQFNPNDTQTKDFYKSNGETVPMKIMYQRNTFNYAENDQYQVLELIYKGDNFSFVVVLPRKKEDLRVTLDTIGDPDEWNKMMESLKPEKCDVSLPKMLINTNIDLKKLLVEIGSNEMFNTSGNGLEGMLETPEKVYVSDAVQEGFLAVDETGTEAAAATVIGIAGGGAPSKIIFCADRPFIYYVVFGCSLIFCGVFVGPIIRIYFALVIATITSVQLDPPKIFIFEAIHSFIYYILFNGVPIFCGTFVGAP